MPDGLQAVVAMTRERVIGRDGRIPWRLPDDFRWFKAKTMGGALLMGRKTFESIGRPLPGRRNIVLTRNPDFKPSGVEVVHDIRGVERLGVESDLYLIGGGELYRALLPNCSDLFVSLVHADYEGDTYFPEFRDRFELAGELLRHPEFTVQHWSRKG